MSCKSGSIHPRTDSCKILYDAVRALRGLTCFGSQLSIFRFVMATTIVFAASSGKLENGHLDYLIRGALAFLPFRGHGKPREMVRLNDELSPTIRLLSSKILPFLASVGLRPKVPSFSCIVGIAGDNHDAQVVNWAPVLLAINKILPKLRLLTTFIEAGGSLQDEEWVQSA